MKRFVRKLLEALYFLLCFGPVPLVVGYAVGGNGFPLFVVSALTIPAAFVISLLPASVGGKERPQDVFVEKKSSSSDPDPDRSLRRDTHEDTVRRRLKLPVRAVVCVIAMLALGAFLLIWPVSLTAPGFFPKMVADRSMLGEEGPFTRTIMCLVPVAMLPLALRFIVTGSSVDTRNFGVGAAIYGVAGVAAYVMRDSFLTGLLAVSGAVFLAVSLWVLNGQAMRIGAASRIGVKPPRDMRKKNRILLIILFAFAALVASFNWLKEKLAWLGTELVKILWEIFMWLGEHMGAQTSGGGGGGGGMGDLAGLGGDTQPSPFWEAMTYVAYVVAAVVLAFLLFLMFRRIYQLLKILIKRIRDYLSRFAQSVGEDYQDEQESLLDWGEMQRDAADAFRRRVKSIFARDKKWTDMDGREKARHVVRVLYRRAKNNGDSRTLREALPDFNTPDPEALAGAYEMARYGDEAPDGALLDKLKKDVRA